MYLLDASPGDEIIDRFTESKIQRFAVQRGTVAGEASAASLPRAKLTHSPVAPFIRHVYYSLLFS